MRHAVSLLNAWRRYREARVSILTATGILPGVVVAGRRVRERLGS